MALDTYTEHSPLNPVNQEDKTGYKAACLNEAFENYVSNPTEENKQEVLDMISDNRNLTKQLKDWANIMENAYVENQLKNLH